MNLSQRTLLALEHHKSKIGTIGSGLRLIDVIYDKEYSDPFRYICRCIYCNSIYICDRRTFPSIKSCGCLPLLNHKKKINRKFSKCEFPAIYPNRLSKD